MNNILDEIEEKTIKQKIFSKLSFGILCLTITLFLYLYVQIPSQIKASEGFPVIHPTLIWGLRLSCILGFVAAVLSFVKKEPSSMLKWVGGIFNILIFLLFLGVMLLPFVLN